MPRHIVQLLAEKTGSSEYAIFEVAALAMCEHNHKAQAHLWWQRYIVAQKEGLDPVCGVNERLMNYFIDWYLPPKEV